MGQAHRGGQNCHGSWAGSLAVQAKAEGAHLVDGGSSEKTAKGASALGALGLDLGALGPGISDRIVGY